MPDRQQSTLGLKVLAFLMAVALWGFVGISKHNQSPPDAAKASPEPTRL